MNTKMIVTRTRCVPTHRDPTSVAVFRVTKGTAEHAQVNRTELLHCLDCKGYESFNATPKMDFLRSCFLIADIDECTSPERNSCHSNTLCTNTEGSYICRCLIGYSGDGKNCTGKFSKGYIR